MIICHPPVARMSKKRVPHTNRLSIWNVILEINKQLLFTYIRGTIQLWKRPFATGAWFLGAAANRITPGGPGQLRRWRYFNVKTKGSSLGSMVRGSSYPFPVPHLAAATRKWLTAHLPGVEKLSLPSALQGGGWLFIGSCPCRWRITGLAECDPPAPNLGYPKVILTIPCW